MIADVLLPFLARISPLALPATCALLLSSPRRVRIGGISWHSYPARRAPVCQLVKDSHRQRGGRLLGAEPAALSHLWRAGAIYLCIVGSRRGALRAFERLFLFSAGASVRSAPRSFPRRVCAGGQHLGQTLRQ